MAQQQQSFKMSAYEFASHHPTSTIDPSGTCQFAEGHYVRPEQFEELAHELRNGRVIRSADDIKPFTEELRDKFHGTAACVVQPGTVAEVQAVMRFATRHQIAVVPQGGNTGLVGGQIPDQSGTQLIISMARLNSIREVSADGYTMCAEAGVTLQQLNEAAEQAGLLFPLSIASRGSCQLGGFLSTNAGGTAVLAYGNTRDLVLSLEVVLPDGRLWNGLHRLRKNNTGYDLKHLFIGGEGTLGIITAAELKLFDQPRGKTTAFVGLADLNAVHRLFLHAKSHFGRNLVAFEFIPQMGMEFVLKHGAQVRAPLTQLYPWQVLLEATSEQSDVDAATAMEQALAAAVESEIATDAVIAQSQSQAEQFWKVRDLMSETQRPEGGSIKHDIAVPVAALPAFIDQATELALKLIPECRPLPFGHYGDGNVHFNISQPINMDKQEFLDQWRPLADQVHSLAVSLGGTMSAEHGIGQLKRPDMSRHKDPVELELMRAVKQAIDPNGLMNPKKMLPDQ